MHTQQSPYDQVKLMCVVVVVGGGGRRASIYASFETLGHIRA